MRRDEMIKRIDNLQIHEKDYDTLLNLLNNADDRFFVKVLEELLEGNLYLQDFERIFSDNRYENVLEQNLMTQRNLQKEIQRLIDYRTNILKEVYDIDSFGKLGIPRQINGSFYDSLYETLDAEIKDDLIYQLLEVSPQDTEIIRDSKIKILSKFTSGEVSRNDILLFANSHIIPIAYEYQTLNNADNEFMYERGLTEEQMKKIKALATFFRRNNFEG